MNRKNLFKAISLDGNSWSYGVVYELPDNIMIMIDRFRFENYGYKCDIVLESFKIKPETLCQYTNRKDKHGKKIFENDILKQTFKDGSSIKMLVYMCEIEGVWKVKEIPFDESKTDCIFRKNWNALKNMEIIGNKISNPELLGDK